MVSLLATFGDDLGAYLADFGPVVFYLIVWGLVFAGTGLFLGAFIPFITGDTLLFASGIVAATTDRVNIAGLALGVGVAAWAGDQTGYTLGRRLGRPYLERQRGRFAQEAIRRSEHFYTLYGWWAVVVARFVPWGRVFIPAIAGVSHMDRAKFVTSNLFGAMAWGVGLVFTGYFAVSVPAVKSAAYVIASIVIAMSVVAGVRAWRLDRRTRSGQ